MLHICSSCSCGRRRAVIIILYYLYTRKVKR
jgi:hypothetical protein